MANATAPLDPAPQRILLVLLVLLLAVLLPSLLAAPFGRDQGIYAWMAEGLLQGQKLYVDVWDHKGPLAPLLYAGSFSVFGVSALAVRLLDVVLLLAALGALIYHRSLAGWASAFFFLLLVSPDWWRSGQPDLWAAEFLILAIALAERQTMRAVFSAGFFLGLTLWIKPLYGLLALPFGARLLYKALKGGWRDDRHFLAGLCGGLVPSFLFLIGLAETGTLAALQEALVSFNLSAHVEVANQGILPEWTVLVLPVSSWQDPLLWSALPVMALALLGLRRSGGYGASLMVASWLCIALQGHFAYYHYFPFFAAVAWSAGAGLELCLSSPRWRLPFFVVVLLLQTPFLLMVGKSALPYWTGQAEAAAIAAPEGFVYTATRDAAIRMAALTTPEDKVYLWGYDALVFFLSQRQSASRYGFNYPLLVGDVAARRDEVMGQLTLHPPKLIVVQTADRNSLLKQTSAEALPEFSALEQFMQAQYHEVWRNEGFILYQRN